MGGAQPLAAVMNGAAALVIEVDASRIQRRLDTKYLDEATDDLDEALARVTRWTREGIAKSIGLRGNAADVPAGARRARCHARRAHRPDVGARRPERLRA